MSEFSIEVIRPWKPEDFAIRFCLFDFDGTVSLIRQGWQDIMIPYFCEELRKTGCTESDENIYGLVREFVTDLTGKQTIFQCIALAEEVRRVEGGIPEPPGETNPGPKGRAGRRPISTGGMDGSGNQRLSGRIARERSALLPCQRHRRGVGS